MSAHYNLVQALYHPAEDEERRDGHAIIIISHTTRGAPDSHSDGMRSVRSGAVAVATEEQMTS